MSLSETVDYWDKARKKANAKEIWLIRLYYDDESAADYIGISDRDITMDSIFYRNIVDKFDDLSEKINLLKSSASIGNVDIVCQNKYASGTLSEELWPTGQGANNYYYINRKVEIYSRFGDTLAIAKCRLIYEGRLFNISQSDSDITLHIEQKTPQDYIKIPNTIVTASGGKYVPVIYGAYDSGVDDDKPEDVHPLPIVQVRNNEIFAAHHQTEASEAHLKHYHKRIDEFHPFDPEDTDTEAYLTSFHISRAPADLDRGFDFWPQGAHADNEFTNPTYPIDEDGATAAATSQLNIATPQTATKDLVLEVPEIGEGTCYSALVLHVDWSVTHEWGAGAGGGIIHSKLGHQLYGAGSATDLGTILTKNPLPSSAGGPESSGAQTDTFDMLAGYNANGHVLPSVIKLVHSFQLITNSTAVQSNCSVTKVWITAQIKLDVDNEPTASTKALDDLDTVYCGSDGFDRDFNGGSGTAVRCHDIFRDMLDRYAGFDVADANMTNYTSLDASRNTVYWLARFWALEPESLADILERLQFEGGFIFKYHPSGGKFIFVKNTYSSSDVAHNITKNDYEPGSLKTTLTDFSEIVTTVIYRYLKHPATGKLLTEATFTSGDGSSSRTNLWPSIAAEENIAEETLEYITGDPTGGSDPNNSHSFYYDNIRATPKILAPCNIINPAMFDLEIGDIVTFDESFVSYGKTTTVYFMLTSTRRNVGSLSIEGREVYDA